MTSLSARRLLLQYCNRGASYITSIGQVLSHLSTTSLPEPMMLRAHRPGRSAKIPRVWSPQTPPPGDGRLNLESPATGKAGRLFSSPLQRRGRGVERLEVASKNHGIDVTWPEEEPTGDPAADGRRPQDDPPLSGIIASSSSSLLSWGSRIGPKARRQGPSAADQTSRINVTSAMGPTET